jgi:lipopolysaccharide transport protein LptA
MVPSRPSSLFGASTALTVLLALVSGPMLGQNARAAGNAPVGLGQNKCTEDIDVKADSFKGDFKSNSAVQLHNVVISQCDIRVEAKQASATGLNFDNTRWVFDGDVRIDVENRGSLRSKQAVVDFQNNQISKATITGSPAEFEQRQAQSDLMARGHAGEIVYEVVAGTVRLANDAWLKYGTTEMKGSNLVYNIRQENVQGAARAGDKERVHIRISPKSKTVTPVPKSDSNAKAPGSATPAPPAPRTP